MEPILQLRTLPTALCLIGVLFLPLAVSTASARPADPSRATLHAQDLQDKLDGHAIGSTVLFLTSRWPDLFPRSATADVLLATFDADTSMAKLLEKEYRTKSLEAVRDLLFARGVYLELNVAGTKPFGLFKILKLHGNQVSVKVLWRSKPEPTNGYFLIDSVSGRFYVISGDGANLLIRVADRDRNKISGLLTEGSWPVRIHRAGVLLLTAYASDRIISQCPAVLKEGPELRLRALVAAGVAAVGGMEKAPGDQIATQFFRAVTSTSEFKQCPYLAFRYLGMGVDPLSFAGAFKVVSYSHLAILGRVAKACEEKDGRLDLDNFGICAWELFNRMDTVEFAQFFEGIGQDPEEWAWAFDFVSKTTSLLGSDEAENYCAAALKVGFHIIECMALLGVENHQQRRYLIGTLEMSWFESGILRMETLNETFEVARARELPILSASYVTNQYDTCSTPVFWKKRWWRFCSP